MPTLSSPRKKGKRLQNTFSTARTDYSHKCVSIPALSLYELERKCDSLYRLLLAESKGDKLKKNKLHTVVWTDLSEI